MVKHSHIQSSNKYHVYAIVLDEKIRYIGQTKNLKNRQSSHRSAFKKGQSKELYNWMRYNGYTEEDIVLEVVFSTSNAIECECMEAFIILKDWFEGDRLLKQSLPKRVKYY